MSPYLIRTLVCGVKEMRALPKRLSPLMRQRGVVGEKLFVEYPGARIAVRRFIQDVFFTLGSMPTVGSALSIGGGRAPGAALTN